MCTFGQLPLALRLATEGELPTDENGNYLWPMFPGTPVTELTVFFRRLPAPGLDVTGTLALCGYPAPKPRENGDINKSVALDVVKLVAVVKDDTFVVGIDYPDEAKGCYDDNNRMLRGRDLVPKFRAGAHKFDQLLGIVSAHMPIQDLFFVNCSAAGKYAFPFVLPKLQQSCLTHSVNFHGPHYAWYATWNMIGQRGSVKLQVATAALTVVWHLKNGGYNGDDVRGLAELCGIENHSVVGQSFENFRAGTREKLEAYKSFVSDVVPKLLFERKIKVERVIDDVTIITQYPLDCSELWDHLSPATAKWLLSRKSTFTDSNAGAAKQHLGGVTVIAETGGVRFEKSYSDRQRKKGAAFNQDHDHQSYAQSCRTTESLSEGASEGHKTFAARDPAAYKAAQAARATKYPNPTPAQQRKIEEGRRYRAKKKAEKEAAAEEAKKAKPMPAPQAYKPLDVPALRALKARYDAGDLDAAAFSAEKARLLGLAGADPAGAAT